jgi:LacI family transcriptional regulator
MEKVVYNIRDLAGTLGLSITTVSRVLNGKAKRYRIKEETQQRIIKAAKQHKYTPNKLARGLKLAKTDTLGLIIPDISNPFFADIAQSIEKEARSKGYSIFLGDSGEDYRLEMELIDLLLSHKVDGIIIAPVGIDFKHIIQTYNSGIPLVVIDRCFPEIGVPFITSDNYQGGLDAVNYLISMGHRKIVCIQGIPKSQPNIERIQGYKDALRNNGIHIENNLIVGDDYSVENGYKQTKIIFSMDDPPTAIFALSNLIGLGVIKALTEMGLRIPHNVSLISFDEQPYSAFLGTPMTTIDQKKNEMGQLAVDVLLKYITNKKYREKVIRMTLKTNLIVRDSVLKIS